LGAGVNGAYFEAAREEPFEDGEGMSIKEDVRICWMFCSS
jgi:hypothetical protein